MGGTFGSRLERLNWPGIALAAVMGLFAIGMLLAFGVQGPGLLDRLAGGANTTPTPGLVSQVGGTPKITPNGTPIVAPIAPPVAADPPTATATATATPVTIVVAVPPTPTLAPSATPPPTSTPEPLPTDTPVPLPTDTPTPTATATVSPTPTTTPTLGPNPTLVACLDQIDPSLQTYLLAQDYATQAVYGCPDSPPLSGTAQTLPLDHGYIVGFDMTPDMLVVYSDSQQWERQYVPDQGGEPPIEPPPPDQPPVEPPPDGRFIPTGRFGFLWSQNDRGEELGYALAPEPSAFPAVYQSFPSALMILNRDSGEVVVLPAANFR